MKIFDLIKQYIHSKQIEQLQNPMYDEVWKELLHYDINNDIDEVIEQKPTEEQIRREQIKHTSSIILSFEDLKKEDIVKDIKNEYNKILLNDADIQALMAIYNSIEYEERYGNCKIREFIEEDEKNIVEIVDKLISKAREEAKKSGTENIEEFIYTDYESINKIKEQIEMNDNEMEIE